MWMGLAVVVAVSSGVLFQCLGCASLLGDEAIHAVVAREGAESGQWLPLRFGGGLYLNKPPLKILLVTALFAVFGEGELLARIPDAVFGVATIALVYLFAARRYGIGTGLLAACTLLGAKSYVVSHGVRDSVQDALITLLALAIVCAWTSYREGDQRSRKAWWSAAIAVIAVGLCKNAIGILFALTIVAVEAGAFVFSRRRSKVMVPAVGLLGVAVGATGLYSVVMIVFTNGRFAAKFVDDVFVRATTGIAPGHLAGPLYYPVRLALDFGWWLLLLVPAAVAIIAQKDRNARTAAWLGAWTLAVLVGFSLSVSKLPWYIYPAYPTLSVLVAIGAWQLWQIVPRGAGRAAIAVLVVIASLLRLGGVWRAVSADVRVVESAVFVQHLAVLENPQLIVHMPSIKKHGNIKPWNRFYLGSIPDVQWVERWNQPYSADSQACLFMACGDPRDFPPTRTHPWRTVAMIPRVNPSDPDIWIIGTCDLEVPDGIKAEGPQWADLRTAEGFERGDHGGVEPAAESAPVGSAEVR